MALRRCTCKTSSCRPVRLMLRDDPATSPQHPRPRADAPPLSYLPRPTRVGAPDRDTADAGRGR